MFVRNARCWLVVTICLQTTACAPANDGSGLAAATRSAKALDDAHSPIAANAQALLGHPHKPQRARPCADDIAPKYRAFAEAVEAERAQLGVPGVSIALLEHGQLSFAHGFGVKGPDSHALVDANTLFRIGSMTKALTATALLSAADEHGVPLSQPVQARLPDVQLQGPEYAALTLRHLLSHQSGLFDYLTIDDAHDDAALSSFVTSAQFASDVYFMVEPGTFYNYSNPNYALAGLALERIDGRYYRRAMQQRVLEPLGMRRTYFLPSEVLADGNYSAGSRTGTPDDIAIEPDAYDNAWARPAGYAFSSVVDYARFAQFLLNGKRTVLAEPSRHALQTSQVQTAEFGDYSGYGYGLGVYSAFALGADFYPTRIVQHDGAIPGFASVFLVLPESGFGLVMFANRDGGLLPNALTTALKQFGGLPEPSPLPADVRPDPSLFPSYAGTYDEPHNFGPITISVENGALMVASPGADAAGIQYERELLPVSVNNFQLTLQDGPLLVTFLRDESGEFSWLRTRAFVAKRMAAPTH